MQPLALAGQVLSAIAARVTGADASHPAAGDGYRGWILTLTSLLVVFAVGSAASRMARQLDRTLPSELTLLLNGSAAFYRRWPEHRQAGAPVGELMAEATRCQRIIELLEQREAAGIVGGPAARGPIDGLNAWIALLHKQINARDVAPAGPAYV
ncbi:hypothetical protein [Mycolicibacterium komossense]|uniref:Uncharacterized protein n=1 Tax=Mycolicibacterium komossense TaxID=1779 RepID=A0ABT3CHW0_9MYCO|nr:hypothetical protein [Mycolicibacterium komossense]MCV7229027.1 hypothetical protein [Mycolicibacterium komossense]